MKMKALTLVNVLLTCVLVGSIIFSVMSTNTTSSVEYDPWLDYNDDGNIDLKDVFATALAYGAIGENMTKAALSYDSGWVNITDKQGQYTNLTHNLNLTDPDSPDIIFDITGKTTPGSQTLLGLGRSQAQWNQTYGGTSADNAYSVVETSDGGYALAGSTSSFGAGSYDAWLVKTDSTGDMVWNRTYGGSDSDHARCVVETSDGGYALAGYTDSFDVGYGDFWLVKTDATGDMLWNNTYGGAQGEGAYSVVETSDGGYALAGSTVSFGPGVADFWLVKIGGECGLAWTGSTAGTITLYRGLTDGYWNYVRVRIWKIRETP